MRGCVSARATAPPTQLIGRESRGQKGERSLSRGQQGNEQTNAAEEDAADVALGLDSPVSRPSKRPGRHHWLPLGRGTVGMPVPSGDVEPEVLDPEVAMSESPLRGLSGRKGQAPSSAPPGPGWWARDGATYPADRTTAAGFHSSGRACGGRPGCWEDSWRWWWWRCQSWRSSGVALGQSQACPRVHGTAVGATDLEVNMGCRALGIAAVAE